MSKHVWFVVTVLTALVLVIGACTPAPTQPAASATQAPAAQAPAAQTETPFRIALVMPGKKNDYALSQAAYDAVVRLQNEMGKDKLEFVYSEGMGNVDDAAAAIRDYASQGYNLIIASGSQYGNALKDIAKEFPKVSFTWGTTVDTFGLPNVYSFAINSDEGGYVGGVMAAKLSKSGKIGYVGPIETGAPKRSADGFVAGVKATRPDAEINVAWTGSYGDVSLASQAAQTHLNNGADVLAGETQMSVGAVTAAQQGNAAWFGSQTDFAPLAPKTVFASSVYRFDLQFKQMIENIKQGKLGGQVLVGDLKNGGLEIAINPDFALPAEVKAAGEAAIKGLQDGSIKTGIAPLQGN